MHYSYLVKIRVIFENAKGKLPLSAQLIYCMPLVYMAIDAKIFSQSNFRNTHTVTKILLTFASETDRLFYCAHIICGSDSVCARVFGDQVQDVHGHVAKVMNWPEPMAQCDRATIFEPLNMEVWIPKGFNLSLKVGILSLDHIVQ